MITSVTRLRLRSLRFLPPFIWYSLRAARQASGAWGFKGGKLLVDLGRVFWTMTSWEDEKAMLAYRNAGIHRRVMPSLSEWCNESTACHWTHEPEPLATWVEAHNRITASGRSIPIKLPTLLHQTRRFALPRSASRFTELPIRPRLQAASEQNSDGSAGRAS